MSNSVGGNSVGRRVAEDYLVNTLGSRVAVIGGANIFGEHPAHEWNGFKECVSRLFGLFFAGAAGVAVGVWDVPEAFEYLVSQVLKQPADPLLDSIEDTLMRDSPGAVVAGIDYFLYCFHYAGDVLAGRQRHLIKVVDARLCFIIGIDYRFHDDCKPVAL